jgi:hypothetical protein
VAVEQFYGSRFPVGGLRVLGLGFPMFAAPEEEGWERRRTSSGGGVAGGGGEAVR